MTWKERLIGLPLALLGALLLLVTMVGIALTGTGWGRERIRGFALEQINSRIAGRVQIDAFVEGDFLSRIRLAGLAIYGPDGEAIASADTVALRYRWSDFLIGDIAFSAVTLVEPTVRLVESTDGLNLGRAFASPLPSVAASDTAARVDGPSRSIVLRRVAIRSGTISLSQPVDPSGREEARDGLWNLKERQGVLYRHAELTRLNATVPIARVVGPADAGRLLQIAQLTARVDALKEPIEVEQLRADLEQRGDTLRFEVYEGVFPGSNVFGRGWVTTSDPLRLDLTIRADPLATGDFLWIDPRLPVGTARVDLRLRRLAEGTAIDVANLMWESPDARLSGTFGARLGEGRPAFRDVDLEIDRLRTSLVERLLERGSPVAGLIAGHLALDGPTSELNVDADLRFEPDTGTASRIGVSGTFLSGSDELGARAARITLDTLSLDLVRAFVPDLAVRGMLAGAVRLDGRLGDGVGVYFDVRHSDAPRIGSRLRGGGRIRRQADRPIRVDLAMLPDPISLTTLAEYYPAIPLRGDFTGRIEIAGTVRRLELDGRLGGVGDSLLIGGELRDLDRVPEYRGELRGWRVRLASLRPGIAPTDLDFRLEVEGRGLSTRDIQLRAHLDVLPDFVGGVRVDTAYTDLRFGDGALAVDTAVVAAEFGTIRASGGLALGEGLTDTLSFELSGDSLGGLNPWLFPSAAPGPLMATDGGDADQGVAGSGIEGAGSIGGSLTGDIRQLRVRGGADLRAVSYEHWSADRLRITHLTAGDLRDSLDIEGEVTISGGRFGEFEIGEAGLRGELAGGVGRLEFDLTASERLAARGRVWTRFGQGVRTLGVDELTVRVGDATWRTTGPSRLRLEESGSLFVERFALESAAGRLAVNGSIGASGPVTFTAEASGLDLGQLGALWPDSLDIGGLLSARVELAGRTRDPTADIRLEIAEGRFYGVSFSSFGGRADYEAGEVSLDLDMQRGAARLFRLNGTVPARLTLPEFALDFPEQAIRLSFEGDSIPLSLISPATDEIENVRGHASASILIRGSPQDISLVGQAELASGGVRVLTTGITYQQLRGPLLFKGGRIELDGLTFRGATGGQGRLTGSIDIRDLDRPIFDLELQAEALPAYARADARMSISRTLRLTGPWDAPVVEGDLTVVSGVLFIEEIGRRQEIVDPFEEEFVLIDTTFVGRGGPAGAEGGFLDRMRLRLDLRVSGATWLRSDEANVEIAGNLTLRADPGQEQMRIDGALQALRGSYQLYGKTFQVVEGDIEFVGTPGLNPNIRIVARYQVRTQKRPITIRLLITGTLENPQLALESDAQPPINESDLLSYLLFGRPTYEITRAGGAGGTSLLQQAGTDVLATSFGYALESLLAAETGIDYVEVRRAPVGSVEGAEGGLAPALAATQVEVGWYLAPTIFVSVAQQLAGAVSHPTVRVEWRLDERLTLRGITEPRFGREGALVSGAGGGTDLTQSFGLFLFYGWTY